MKSEKIMQLNLLKSLILAMLLTLVSACGGGSESSTTDNTTTDGDTTPSTTNSAPVANAGNDQVGDVNDIVTLNGSGSNDADNDTLTYRWSFVSQPDSSSASLNNDQSVMPSFSLDVAGEYIISLVVNDGTVNSAVDEVTITAENEAPRANDDSTSVISGNTISIELVANSESTQTLSYQIETQASNGNVTLNNNIASYQANNGFVGNDSFTFSASDGDNKSNTATINIEVVALSETTTLHDGRVVITADLVALGNLLYTDSNLSNPVGQSCASCHDLNTGFDDPNSSNPTSVGADGDSFGTRNSPTASYSAHIPAPTRQRNGLVGGLFIDGRAQSLEEQAKAPFTNPVEMANASAAEVIEKVSNATYASDFENLFGETVFTDNALSFNYVADAIAAFERTDVFSPFSAKFDQVQAGNATFTAAEARGLDLFNNKADCHRCHHTNNGLEVFSDFAYENIGVPKNPQLPALIADASFIDLGLGGESGDNRENGRFRTPTLRNIADTAPYMHNGVFNSLREVIDFYNTRDTSFPDDPEVNQNVDQGGRIGELGLTDNEIDDLIVFLETLSDQ